MLVSWVHSSGNNTLLTKVTSTHKIFFSNGCFSLEALLTLVLTPLPFRLKADAYHFKKEAELEMCMLPSGNLELHICSQSF